jgi:hypothetical protein
MKLPANSLLLLILTLLVATVAQAQDWVTNGVVSMKVNGVQEITKLEDLGKLKRYGTKEKNNNILGNISKGLKSGEYKIVLVDLTIKNIDKQHRVVGYDTYSGVGTWPHYAGLLYLRSADGAEVNSSNSFNFDSDPGHNHQGKYAGSQLTYHLADGLPMSSKIAPGASVTGKVAFVVPDWFEPKKLFTHTDDSDANWKYGTKQCVLSL